MIQADQLQILKKTNNPTSNISNSGTQQQTIQYQRVPAFRNVAIFQKYILDNNCIPLQH